MVETVSKTQSKGRIPNATLLTETLCAHFATGVKQLYEQIDLTTLSSKTSRKRMKLLYKDLEAVLTLLYNEANPASYESGAGKGKGTSETLKTAAYELDQILEALDIANCGEEGSERFHSGEERVLYKELDQERRAFEYAMLREEQRNYKPKKFGKLRRTIFAWCDANMKHANRQTHYEALRAYAREKTVKKAEDQVELVLFEGHMRNAGSINDTDLEIQTVARLAGKPPLLTLVPGNVTNYLEGRLFRGMTKLDFSILKESTSTLQTALHLYTENPTVSFQKYVLIASQL